MKCIINIVLVCCLAAVALSGCASVATRTWKRQETKHVLYPAAKTDAAYCEYFLDAMPDYGTDYPPFFLLPIFDLPFSLAVDTLFLPYDMYQRKFATEESKTMQTLPNYNAKFSLQVLDEDGFVDFDTRSIIVFEQSVATIDGQTVWRANSPIFRGGMNEEGLFTVESSCNGHITFWVERDGEALTKDVHYEFAGLKEGEDGNVKSWQPWNPVVTVSVQKAKSPLAVM